MNNMDSCYVSYKNHISNIFLYFSTYHETRDLSKPSEISITD